MLIPNILFIERFLNISTDISLEMIKIRNNQAYEIAHY
jgi:hypothetical protein